MTADTPGTPETTWPTEARAVVKAIVRAYRPERDSLDEIADDLLVGLAEFVAAREAAAEQRGAEQELRGTLTWLIRYGVESEITNHLLATLFALGAAAVADGGAS